MKILKVTLLFDCTIVIMMGCLGNTGSEPTVITDPSATTHLYITNQSGLDLSVAYTTGEYAGLDSTVSVSPDSKARIFEPGGFSFPAPSEALA